MREACAMERARDSLLCECKPVINGKQTDEVHVFFVFAITFITSVRRAPCHAGHLA